MPLNKKAQFYLFIMILLIALVTTFILAKPVSTNVDRSFENYFDNIDRESEYVINNALMAQANITDELDTFFTQISALGKTKRMTLSYFYLLVNKTNFTFYNNLDSDVYILDYNLTLSKGQTSTIARDEATKIGFQASTGVPDLTNFIYKFYITEEDNQIRYLLLAKRGDQYDLHIRDNS